MQVGQFYVKKNDFLHQKILSKGGRVNYPLKGGGYQGSAGNCWLKRFKAFCCLNMPKYLRVLKDNYRCVSSSKMLYFRHV